MPYRFVITQDGRCLRRIGEGVLTGQEIIRAVRALPEEVPEPERITHGLVDLTAVTRLEITTAELETIATLDRGHSQRFKVTRVAIVAPTDLAFGLARMYEAAVAQVGWEVRVVRDLPSAEAWLAEMGDH